MNSEKEFFHRGSAWLRGVRQWLSAWVRPWGARQQRQLRLCENLALGERRFLSVVECGQQKFLVGGSADSVMVLTELGGEAGAGQKDGEGVATYKFVAGKLTKDERCG